MKPHISEALDKLAHNGRWDPGERPRSKCIEDKVHAMDHYGYPVRKVNGEVVHVCRLALEKKLGRPIRPGMVAAHTCDNRRCVNPAPLEETSKGTNSDDMQAKKRGLGPYPRKDIVRKQ